MLAEWLIIPQYDVGEGKGKGGVGGVGGGGSRSRRKRRFQTKMFSVKQLSANAFKAPIHIFLQKVRIVYAKLLYNNYMEKTEIKMKWK